MERVDVAIAGAGPAGSVLAALLARQGIRVSVFEKGSFPRFHIGESLLPMAMPVLDELGLDLAQSSYALWKGGAVFLDETTEESCRFAFSLALEGTYPFAYQVERAGFDSDLVRIAQESGAMVHFGHAIDDWEEGEDAVRLSGDWGQCQARFFVDATGQRALLAKRQHSMRKIDSFGKYASFASFSGINETKAREVFVEGDIIILMLPKAWAWLIPLVDNRLSVGFVEKEPPPRRNAEDAVRSLLSQSPLLQELLEGATQTQPYRRISNFSFYNEQPHTKRMVALGDAHAFLDPIFSSGVTLAILSAHRLAEEFAVMFAQGASTLQLDGYESYLQQGYETFERLIERFYRPNWIHNIFFAKDKEERFIREITAMLAADVWRDDNGFQQMMLKSRKRRVRAA